MTTAPPSRLRCVECSAEAATFFQVARVDHEGKPLGGKTQLVHTCSLVCLGKWLYRYGVHRGISGMSMLQQAWQGLRGVRPTGTPKR